MFDTSHPMLRPLWVRLLICVISCGWAILEWSLGHVTWATIFGLCGATMIYLLLLTYQPSEDKTE